MNANLEEIVMALAFRLKTGHVAIKDYLTYLTLLLEQQAPPPI